MLKAEKLLKLRGCMVRSCRAARMPHHNRPCTDPNSDYNQSLRKWQFEQRLQPTKQPNPCRQRRTLTPPVDHCHPFAMGQYTLSELRGGRFMPDEYKRVHVTKEQRTVLDRYAAKTRFGGTSDNRNPLEVDEQRQPGLATYMRDVMQHNTFYNELYCIDFFNTYDVEGSGAAAGQSSRPNYMDPEELARLLELLSLGIELTPEQLAYLQQFLLQLAMLDPAEMAKYLAMFEKLGLLTPGVLLMLQHMMQDLNIDPRRLQALDAVLGVALQKAMAAIAAAEAAAAAAAAAKARAAGYADDATGGGVIKQKKPERVFGPDGFDANGFDRNGRDRHGFDKNGFDANGFDRLGFDRDGRDRNGMTRAEIEKKQREQREERERQQQERARQKQEVKAKLYQKPEVNLARKKVGPACGVACKGYYEPWDAELSWEETQELVERAVAWRMMRLDWDKFNYIRGLEKYVAEWERDRPKPSPLNTRSADKAKAKR